MSAVGRDEAGSPRFKIAVVGAGISGLSAAWLLSRQHDVTVYERDARLGGHSNTVDAQEGARNVAIDTGFIVFNPLNYPNLVQLFAHLGVETSPSDMSFAVSLDNGALEYGGGSLSSLFAQRSNLVSPRFWSMLKDLTRFYRTAPAAIQGGADDSITLGEFLDAHGYGEAFVKDHLLPMAGAIWSAAPGALAAYPAASFIRFFENHGLLKFSDRPPWRTVKGGSRAYVAKITSGLRAHVSAPVSRIERHDAGVRITAAGDTQDFDRVLIAAHADEALAMLADPSQREQALLSQFSYTKNDTILHTDAAVMPKRRAVWSSWNYIGKREGEHRDICVSYWMNKLQPLDTATQYFVTLNPEREIDPALIVSRHVYEHPVFTVAALRAQQQLSQLQGERNTWFCGAYFGAGFHEDGLRSGLAAAEDMGSVRRPWALPAAALSQRHSEAAE